MIVEPILAGIRHASGMLLVIAFAMVPVVNTGMHGQHHVATSLDHHDDPGKADITQASKNNKSHHHDHAGRHNNGEVDQQFKFQDEGHDPADHSHEKAQIWRGALPEASPNGEPRAGTRPDPRKEDLKWRLERPPRAA